MALVHDIKVSNKMIKTEEFIAVPNNPKQRDTVRHAKKAVNKHLAELSASHLRVAMAELDGKFIKLDGHTRSYLWDLGTLEQPSHVMVDVYHVQTKEDVLNLYDHFDNAAAAESAPDKLSGAFRYHGIEAISAVWRNSGTTALKVLYNAGTSRVMSSVDILEPVALFKVAIKRLDSLNVSTRNFPGPVLAAALVSVQRDKGTALSFWDAYNNDLGKKHAKSFDPIYALSKHILDLRSEQMFHRGSQRSIIEHTPTFLEIYDQWSIGETRMKKIPKSKKLLVQAVNQFIPDVLKKTPHYDAVYEQYLSGGK